MSLKIPTRNRLQPEKLPAGLDRNNTAGGEKKRTCGKGLSLRTGFFIAGEAIRGKKKENPILEG